MAKQLGFADVDGAQLAYETVGSGSPAVFVYGFSLDQRMWDEQVDAFADKHQVIRYDVRQVVLEFVAEVDDAEGFRHTE